MLTPDQVTIVRPKLFTIQIMSAAMIVGVLVFTGVICTIVDWGNLNANLKMLSLIGAVTGLMMIVLSLVVPKVFASGNQAASPTDQSSAISKLTNSLLTENLIRFVLIEAALFLNLMVFLIEPHRAALVIVGIGVVLMLLCFPRQSKMIATIEDRLDQDRPT